MLFALFADLGDRDRLAYLYLKNQPHLLSRGTKLLHVAPEYNLRSWLCSKVELDYVSADLSMGNVDLNIDLTQIPFPNSTFGAIICNHVLEHIPNDRAAMAELFRVLKSDGWAMLQVPISFHLAATDEDFSITDPMDRERAFGQNDHVRIYAMDYRGPLEAGWLRGQPVRMAPEQWRLWWREQ